MYSRANKETIVLLQLTDDFPFLFSESNEFLNDLVREPTSLYPEELRYGYISEYSFFNLFHAGFCGPYISNPNYLLLVDFR